MTKRLTSPEGIAEAARLLREGALVAFATETVYGLGADATNAEACARIFEAKGRPRFNPLIVHVADAEAAFDLGAPSEAARRLAAAFWPGPLTLVLARAGPLPDLVTAGLPSVALRVPGHPAAQALLRETGRPLAAPSANPSGRVSPTTADHVLDGLSGRIDAVLDAGPCEVGVESTIVGLGRAPALLRAGGVPAEEIEALIGPLARPGGAITAPGQLASHYAPTAAMRLDAREARPGERLLGFGEVVGERTLSATGDLREAAARLFGMLREMGGGPEGLAVAPIPDEGLGRAINDRLRRAAAPRQS